MASRTTPAWAEIEKPLAPWLAHKDRAGVTVEGVDLFGTVTELVGADAGDFQSGCRSLCCT